MKVRTPPRVTPKGAMSPRAETALFVVLLLVLVAVTWWGLRV